MPPTLAEPAVKPSILVVDDERLVRWSIRQRLKEEDYEVLEAETGKEALERFQDGVDLVVLDYCLPDTDGLEVMRKMLAMDQDAVIIVLTAHSSVDKAVEAMRGGAYHYAPKPFNLDEVAILVEKALETTRLRREVRRLLARGSGAEELDSIIGESRVMKQVKALIRKISTSPATTVLLTGESGTGKDLVARAIHGQSARAGGPFMNITCSALPEALLESELFGHERGAFTDAKEQKIGLLERADGGTVFLDEIGEMTPQLQSKLLRFLEEKCFRRVGGSTEIRPDVRVVAATNRDLQKEVRNHNFREDLYYRLAVLHVHLPPLREREGDLDLLVKYYVHRFNREFHKTVNGISPSALALLSAHTWPGNVRELRNTVERAMLLSEKPVLEEDDFSVITSKSKDVARFQLPPGGVDFTDLERELVIQALERARGNQTQAATLLGMSRDQIRYRIAKFNLTNTGRKLT